MAFSLKSREKLPYPEVTLYYIFNRKNNDNIKELVTKQT